MGIGLLLICASVGTASAKTWYVDDSGGADFTKIQDAINAANESDTIFVYNGSYYERISISKSLTLIGENRSANIIGLGSDKCAYITANNVTIEGFTIRNGDYGVSIENNACDNAIINNTITLNHASGIWIEWSNNNSIINNSIVENDGDGIDVYYKFENSTICNNNISSNSDRGICLYYYSSCNVISNNSINSNGYGGIKLYYSCDHNIISDNTISNNIYGDGIVLGISCYNEIYNNNISLNHDDNLVFKDGSNYNILTRNTVINGNVVFEDTYFNAIHHNNFILPTYTVSDAGSTNSWDNGSIEGGNYWSNHNCSGNPSNGSQPYIIDADSIDHYPFEDHNGWIQVENFIFDTGSGTYPSIMGTHNGTITPSQTITVNKLYTYPCTGTGGHTEYAKIWNETLGECAIAEWAGYSGDYHNISFNKTLTLEKGVIYNYTIRTGSYPQIHHTDALPTTNGWINCTEFTDANGKKYDDWIPAITLE